MKDNHVLQVVRSQRKTILVALALAVAAIWILGVYGQLRVGVCAAIGVGLGLGNHLATEYWLLRVISSGEEPTRSRMTGSTLVRLVILSVIAIGLAIWFWPDGIGVLFGLAIFRLIALVMTTLPLLKELKNQ
ncbi:hypothetical protein [Flexivirga caeni]|uniref:ATP synthase subunit I n=1 Tax=Flexivirga caeni TaxID=2294115 RepID=A0A3M9M5T2_9MICO|nr:hypothetical protein [Flexivirga caeni]RNI20902.1 hypothetical protein EFY87_13455 [Flexivirga caeni]